MNFLKRDLILIKTCEIPVKITGNTNNSFFITKEIGYTLKKICHSNTHLCTNQNIISKINNIYTLVENKINFDDLDKIFAINTKIKNLDCYFEENKQNFHYQKNKYEFDSLFSIRNYLIYTDNNLFLIDLDRLKDVFGYGDDQVDKILDKMMLYRFNDTFCVRFSIKTIYKMNVNLFDCTNLNKIVNYNDKEYDSKLVEWFFKIFEFTDVEKAVLQYLSFHKENDKSKITIYIDDLFDNIDFENLQKYLNKYFFANSKDVLDHVKNIAEFKM